ncbi:MAG: hypothetical protein ACRCUQ_03845 [Alphaproteobacteria bacterium]
MTILEKFSAFSVFLLSALWFQFDLGHQGFPASFKISSSSKESAWVEKSINKKKDQPFFLKNELLEGNFSTPFLLEPSELPRQPEARLVFKPLGKEALAILSPSRGSPSKFQDFSSFPQKVENFWEASEPVAAEALLTFHFSLDTLVGVPLEALVEEGAPDEEARAGAEESPLEQFPAKLPIEVPETLREAGVLVLAEPPLAKKHDALVPADLEEMDLVELVAVVVCPAPPAAKLEGVEILRFSAPAKKAFVFSKLFIEEAEGLKEASVLGPAAPVPVQKPPVISLKALEDMEIEVVSEPVTRGAPCDMVEHVKASEKNKLAAFVAVPVEETTLLRKTCLTSVKPELTIETPAKAKKHGILKKVSTLLARKLWAPSEKSDRSKFSYYGDRGLLGLGSKAGM